MANWQMVSQGVKYHSFAKCVARRACQYTLEITSSPTIWKGYLFHVIIVATLFLQDPVWESTKVNTVRQLELIITNKTGLPAAPKNTNKLPKKLFNVESIG